MIRIYQEIFRLTHQASRSFLPVSSWVSSHVVLPHHFVHCSVLYYYAILEIFTYCWPLRSICTVRKQLCQIFGGILWAISGDNSLQPAHCFDYSSSNVYSYEACLQVKFMKERGNNVVTVQFRTLNGPFSHILMKFLFLPSPLSRKPICETTDIYHSAFISCSHSPSQTVFEWLADPSEIMTDFNWNHKKFQGLKATRN